MSATVDRFRTVLTRALGIRFDDSHVPALSELLERRAGARGTAHYVAQLEDDALGRGELRELAREVTVAETYFFRGAEQLRALTGVVLPTRMRLAESRRLCLLSAGCASGEEPYSLAMLLLEHAAGWDVSVRAVDVNPAVLERAERATYTPWSLRETPGEVERRWFSPRGRDAVVDASVRALVRFDEANLAREDAEVWRGGPYDVVFCRNVLMYFEPETARAVVARMARCLAPGGYLFLGHAETLRGLSSEFHLRHTHGAFYYQLKEPGETDGESVPELPVTDAPSVPPPDWPSGWLDVVRRSSERIRSIGEEADRQSRAPEPTRAAQHGAALALMAQERYADALASLGDARPADTDGLLLRAVLLAQSGRIAEAEAACERLLAVDELSSGAHYVLALCREGAGDVRGAVERDLVAVYLDPSFAMPRLHLGLLARRRGDLETARRELERASALLRVEDASRVLLFGGGFGRDALVTLCAAELARAGGVP